jgi:hypothetical protein
MCRWVEKCGAYEGETVSRSIDLYHCFNIFCAFQYNFEYGSRLNPPGLKLKGKCRLVSGPDLNLCFHIGKFFYIHKKIDVRLTLNTYQHARH